ncbi:MGDG synthase family glycosyltransferase [Brevibacillus borstelensis]|uniref:MGDG synthase family glycosyltransferase n=1 Tax=Brevibacillus borstelensis TaxID=45462 RepID=UPI0030C1C5B2
MNKKVLILSEAFGNGHTAAAQALAQGLARLAPTVRTQIVEAGRELHPTTTALLFQFYVQLIKAFPSAWRKLYLNKHSQPVSKLLQFFIYHLFHRNVNNLLDREKPNLVICTHPFTGSSMARLKRLGYPISLCTVITDFHAHGVYAHPEVDLYLVSSEAVQHELVNLGVDRSRIRITGIPTKSIFWSKHDKQEVRRNLLLKDMPTVMLMGGGFGLGGIERLAHALAKWKESLQLVICAGHNESLKQTLSKHTNFRHPHIRVLGFVDIIDKWMDATDLLITKPGGLTCFEALCKGIPILLYQPIPGHEEKNCDYLIKNNLAERIESEDEADEWVHKLLFHPQEIQLFQDRIGQYVQRIDPLASIESIMKILQL